MTSLFIGMDGWPMLKKLIYRSECLREFTGDDRVNCHCKNRELLRQNWVPPSSCFHIQ